MQAANNEEAVIGQRTWGPKRQGLEQAPLCIHIFGSISRLASSK